MRTINLVAIPLFAVMAATPATATNVEGNWQVKVLATGVMPDGKATKGLPDGVNTRASDNAVPTLSVEYFVTPAVSMETICCLTQHHVTGTGGLAGARLVDHVMILPATVTAKYHFGKGAIRPYVGIGPSLFFVIDEKPGRDARDLLGVSKVKMSNKLGLALQAGADIALGDSGFGLSLDAKKYFNDTTARFYDPHGNKLTTTKHSLEPWVISSGATYRF
jgi:outer membrane protein